MEKYTQVYKFKGKKMIKISNIKTSFDFFMFSIKQKFWQSKLGFSLIEMAIVLVIIGLLSGSVVAGKAIIEAAETRSEISQIEKYNAAVHTFQIKYSAIPGDMNANTATAFGFVARTGSWGGDGNGLIAHTTCCSNMPIGELMVFWVDLSTAGLIDGNFNTAGFVVPASDATLSSTPSIANYLPKAKLRDNLYIYAHADQHCTLGGSGGAGCRTSEPNYFSISAVTSINFSAAGSSRIYGGLGIPVKQAYAIDAKIDDGLPQTGTVIAKYYNGEYYWTDGVNSYYNLPSTSATSATSSTCYDNGNIANATQQYSVGTNGGNGLNCALSFKIQ